MEINMPHLILAIPSVGILLSLMLDRGNYTRWKMLGVYLLGIITTLLIIY